MRGFYRMVLLSLVIMGSTSATLFADVDSDRADVRNKVADTLAALYEMKPGAKSVVEGAAGYAVFSNFGMKIFIAGGGKGKGLAIDNKTKKETFMKMIEAQAGLGFSIKSTNLVWVFQTQESYDSFINSGWEFGGQASAAAKAGTEGGAIEGAVSVSPGVWLYQMTKDGLALDLTVKGTKYYKDSDLN